MRALVVDDSKPVRSILGKMLRELDFEVSEAVNGQEGLVLLQQLGAVDLATVNWNMPLLDGLAFVQAVRADVRFRRVPLVMVTSEDKPSMKARALAAGVNDYIVKPFTKRTLTQVLAKLGFSVEPASKPSPSVTGGSPPSQHRLRVLIVDDSVVIRQTLSKVLSEDPELEVAGTAADGRIALNALEKLAPHVILLDIEMPNMDGFQTLKALRKTHPHLPVIMFSSLTERGAAATLDALMLGANDYVTKPTAVNNFEVAKQCIRDELIPKVKQFTQKSMTPRTSAETTVPTTSRAVEKRKQIELLVVGVSTGGPVALTHLLPCLATNHRVPVVVVQHMPPVFTKHLAQRLAKQGTSPVHEGHDGQRLEPGEIYIAPGGFHSLVARQSGKLVLKLNQDPPQHACRPAADVLFRSAAAATGAATLAVVLTGMGRDALDGCRHIAAAGGQIIVQDEATSVVWGMPGHVARAGLASAILPLERLGNEINRRLRWKEDGPSNS